MTHDQYLDEPAVEVDWTLAFRSMEAEMQQAAIEASRRRGR